jgi:hypothetical protein
MSYVRQALAQAMADNRAAEARLKEERRGQFTAGGKKTFLTRIYLERNHRDVEKAMTDFCRKRHLACHVERESRATPSNLREALDKRIPVLLFRQDASCLVLWGYVTESDGPLFFAYDPRASRPRVVGGESTLSEEDKKSEVEWIGNFVRYRKSKKYYFDHVVDRSNALPPGMSLVRVKKADKAVLIHGFRPEADELWESVRAEVLGEASDGRSASGERPLQRNRGDADDNAKQD